MVALESVKSDEINGIPGKANNFAGSIKKFQINTILRIRTADGVSDESQDNNETETIKTD